MYYIYSTAYSKYGKNKDECVVAYITPIRKTVLFVTYQIRVIKSKSSK